ncbi:hypothetical protein, partial [Phaeodactylibacter xiamenensis]|uniref:hypothetical protein n=1 Tax=Phaeodactylibacter xiamenensis TaxID=1524460 RepID=UPI0024A9471C
LAKTKFIQIAIEQADAERRYSMWLDGYTDEKDYKLIARKIGEEEDIWFKSSIYDIFKRLPEPQEQGLVLKEVALLTGTLDSQFKYDRYKAIVKLSHLDELVKNKFKQIAFQQADTERKYLMWLDGYADEKDSTFIAKKIVEAEFRGGDSSLNKIFEKLVQAEEQLQVLDKFSALIGRLDSQPKYEHFKAIVGLPHLYEPVRNKFKQIAVEQADAERKYLMWLDGYTEIKDLSYIIQKLSSEIHANYSSYLEKNIRRIDSSTEKQYILKNLLSNTAKVDNSDKYVQFKAILNHLEGRNKYDCIQSVFSAADNERKYLIWLDGLIDHIDLELIATHFAKENSEDDYRVYEKVFSKISDPIDQLFTLNQLIVQLESIDSDRKINLVRSILSCVNVNKYVKNKFRSDSILIASTGYIFKLIIQVVGGFQKSKYPKYAGVPLITIYHKDYEYYDWMYLKKNFTYSESKIKEDTVYIEKLLNRVQIDKDSILGYLDTLYPLNTKEKLNNLISFYQSYEYFVNSLNFLKIGIECSYVDKYLIENTKTKPLIDLWVNGIIDNIDLNSFKRICIYLSCLKDEAHLIKSVLRKNNSGINQMLFYIYIDSIQETPELDETIVKTLNLYKSHIGSYHTFEDLIKDVIQHPLNRMKLWLKDLITHFDFNRYSLYYFTLDGSERRLFNKKAKVVMGQKLKASMLKKKEPWKLLESFIDDQGVEKRVFSATWKSIWFLNSKIKICISKDPLFSPPFAWDFSEEKFNLLQNYISGKKLNRLKVTVGSAGIELIEGLEDLEETIYKASITKELETSGTTRLKGIGQHKIPVNMILRNECIQFLNELQLPNLSPTRILERTFYIPRGNSCVDISLLYSIPLLNKEIAIIWESLELDKAKATHIFKCNVAEYEEVFQNLEFHLSNTERVRSSLNSKETDDIKQKIDLRYLGSVRHDNFDFNKWKDGLYDLLPDLHQ